MINIIEKPQNQYFNASLTGEVDFDNIELGGKGVLRYSLIYLPEGRYWGYRIRLKGTKHSSKTANSTLAWFNMQGIIIKTLCKGLIKTIRIFEISLRNE